MGAGNIALVLVATNNFSLDSTGFLAGGQAGYNYQQNKKILLGLNVGFDGLVDSDRTYALQKVVNLTNFDEYYVGSLAVQQRIRQRNP